MRPLRDLGLWVDAEEGEAICIYRHAHNQISPFGFVVVLDLQKLLKMLFTEAVSVSAV